MPYETGPGAAPGRPETRRRNADVPVSIRAECAKACSVIWRLLPRSRFSAWGPGGPARPQRAEKCGKRGHRPLTSTSNLRNCEQSPPAMQLLTNRTIDENRCATRPTTKGDREIYPDYPIMHRFADNANPMARFSHGLGIKILPRLDLSISPNFSSDTSTAREPLAQSIVPSDTPVKVQPRKSTAYNGPQRA